MGQRTAKISGFRHGKITAFVCSIALLGGCITIDGSEYANEPGYIAGYGDGCASAKEAEKSFSTKRVRDETAFAEDKAYQVGWRAGLLQCDYRFDDETSNGGRILGEDQNF